MYTLAILPLLVAVALGVPHWPVPVAQPAPQQSIQAPAAAPQAPAQAGAAPAPLQLVATTQFHAQDNLGKYSFGYASSDGNQVAQARNYDGTVAGRYSYVDASGKPVEVKYVADRGGFRAEGLHLPTGPAQPEALRLAYLEAEQRLAAAKAKDALKAAAAAAAAAAPTSAAGQVQVAAPAPAAPQAAVQANVPVQPVYHYGPIAAPQQFYFPAQPVAQPVAQAVAQPVAPVAPADFRAYTTHTIQEVVQAPAPAPAQVSGTVAVADPAAPQVQQPAPYSHFQTYRVGF